MTMTIIHWLAQKLVASVSMGQLATPGFI